ncbi:MAG TPA: benzoyl-CoA 2,3-epoxidase subunit BoxB [Hyphomicrobiales bacterium]|nr:benzoyl-CoA 2,3-epoxidase subunit BoxB [Hyphomicrobiales bacterium]
MGIDYQSRIPNNVDLATDRSLQRALEHWQPAFLDWWKELGPERYQDRDVYLRTATSVDAKGWASFGYVRMPEYRWGIFLAEPRPDRLIGFGDLKGQPAWQQVPGEFRATLRRLIVTQGDTEPASVEQQRMLGLTAPSLYDLRNLFQVNVEEGRHLWAMVYLLHAFFGSDGREEAEELLYRHSGDADHPRILGTFNQPIDDWLSFFMFTYFTDRDGKYQLKSLAESGFDPLARTCRFMLTEEAHHMFVGETGLGRIVKRTLEVMQELKTDDPDTLRKAGVIDLPLLQRYVNFWYPSSLDLFGSEISSNAATYFANGLKGRPDEDGFADHVAAETAETIETAEGPREVPTRNAMNLITRSAYSRDCAIGLTRWNRTIAKAGFAFEMKLPSERFNRAVGTWAGASFDPDGRPCAREAIAGAMPGEADRAYVRSLMVPVTERGKFAGWIAPPDRGVDNKPLDFDYVRLAA